MSRTDKSMSGLYQSPDKGKVREQLNNLRDHFRTYEDNRELGEVMGWSDILSHEGRSIERYFAKKRINVR